MHLLLLRCRGRGYQRLLQDQILTKSQSILTTPHRTERNPQIAVRTTATMTPESIIVWQSKDDGQTYYDIYAKRVNCDGTSLGNYEIMTIANTSRDQVSPVAVYLEQEEKYLVVWSGDTGETDFDIFAFLVDTEIPSPPRVIETNPEHLAFCV